MLLTEDEAKTKECRAVAPSIVATIAVAKSLSPFSSGGMGTEIPELFGIQKCCASGCMHWRWGEDLNEELDVGNDDPPTPPEGEGWKRCWTHDRHSVTGKHVWRRFLAKRGYCGLAGGP